MKEMNPKVSGKSTDDTLIRRIEKLHPNIVLTYISMTGVFVVILSLVLAFFLSTNDNFENYHFPKPFVLATFFLLFVSFAAERLLILFRKEETSKLKDTALVMIALMFIFATFTILGLVNLLDLKVFDFEQTNAWFAASIVLIVIAISVINMVKLLTLFGKVFSIVRDGVHQLMFFTDPVEEVRLKCLVIFSHWLNIIWCFLFFLYFIVF